MAHRLWIAWGALLALTVLTGVSARVTDSGRPGAVGLIILAAVTVAKARLICSRYLRMDRAPGFLTGITAGVVLVLAVLTVAFLMPPLPQR